MKDLKLPEGMNDIKMPEMRDIDMGSLQGRFKGVGTTASLTTNHSCDQEFLSAADMPFLSPL